MKKIYLLNDYLTSKNTLKNIPEWLGIDANEYEIINIDYTKFYQQTEVDKIDLSCVIEYFNKNILNNVNEDDVLVAIGCSCRILSTFKNNKRILINPLMFNNLINVFTASKRYFDNNLEQFKIYLDKLIDTNNFDVDSEYKWYSENYNKIIKLTEKINLYETLKSLISSDEDLFSDSLVLISDNNQILDNKTTLKYLNKKLAKKVLFELKATHSNKHLEIDK